MTLRHEEWRCKTHRSPLQIGLLRQRDLVWNILADLVHHLAFVISDERRYAYMNLGPLVVRSDREIFCRSLIDKGILISHRPRSEFHCCDVEFELVQVGPGIDRPQRSHLEGIHLAAIDQRHSIIPAAREYFGSWPSHLHRDLSEVPIQRRVDSRVSHLVVNAR